MTPLEQIKVLQQLAHDNEEHLVKLSQENAELRARVEIPRDMQQEANLLARENNEEWVKRRIQELEGEVERLGAALNKEADAAEILEAERNAALGLLWKIDDTDVMRSVDEQLHNEFTGLLAKYPSAWTPCGSCDLCLQGDEQRCVQGG